VSFGSNKWPQELHLLPGLLAQCIHILLKVLYHLLYKGAYAINKHRNSNNAHAHMILCCKEIKKGYKVHTYTALWPTLSTHEWKEESPTHLWWAIQVLQRQGKHTVISKHLQIPVFQCNTFRCRDNRLPASTIVKTQLYSPTFSLFMIAIFSTGYENGWRPWFGTLEKDLQLSIDSKEYWWA